MQNCPCIFSLRCLAFSHRDGHRNWRARYQQTWAWTHRWGQITNGVHCQQKPVGLICVWHHQGWIVSTGSKVGIQTWVSWPKYLGETYSEPKVLYEQFLGPVEQFCHEIPVPAEWDAHTHMAAMTYILKICVKGTPRVSVMQMFQTLLAENWMTFEVI